MVPEGLKPTQNEPDYKVSWEKIFEENYQVRLKITDKMFAVLFVFQWVALFIYSFVFFTGDWEAVENLVPTNILVTQLVGLATILFPILLIKFKPGSRVTRHFVAISQILLSALFIHVSGGRIESHFHVFGSLALLASYKDWRVLVTATVIVVLDRIIRGIYWPESIYGASTVENWRWLEHSAWVVFENIFLTYACVYGKRDLRQISIRQSELQHWNMRLNSKVKTVVETFTSNAEQIIKREFISKVSRDCQESLESVRGHLKNFEDQSSILSELQKESLFEIQACNDRALDILKNAPTDLVEKLKKIA